MKLICDLEYSTVLQVPGHEWAVFRLGLRGTPSHIVIDTNHFKVKYLSEASIKLLFQGNFPDSAVLEVTDIAAAYPEDKAVLLDKPHQWRVLLPPVKLGPSQIHHVGSDQFLVSGPNSHLRVKMFPDGGISRIRVMGIPSTNK